MLHWGVQNREPKSRIFVSDFSPPTTTMKTTTTRNRSFWNCVADWTLHQHTVLSQRFFHFQKVIRPGGSAPSLTGSSSCPLPVWRRATRSKGTGWDRESVREKAVEQHRRFLLASRDTSCMRCVGQPGPANWTSFHPTFTWQAAFTSQQMTSDCSPRLGYYAALMRNSMTLDWPQNYSW